MDAVIFALRDNGALVYVPQYGLKGPVYLESKDKEVLLVILIFNIFCIDEQITKFIHTLYKPVSSLRNPQ